MALTKDNYIVAILYTERSVQEDTMLKAELRPIFADSKLKGSLVAHRVADHIMEWLGDESE